MLLFEIYRKARSNPSVLLDPYVAVVALSPLLALAVGWLIVSAVREDDRQDALVRSGVCEAQQEALYAPPGHIQCVVRSGSGMCVIKEWVRPAPYMRTLWACPEERPFWRRSER